MADIALGSVGNIISIGLKIKEAAKNVKQNEKECRDMERCVARVTRIIDCFAQTLKRYDEASTPVTIHKDSNMSMHDALEDLAKSLEGALHLVTKCQRRHSLHSMGAGDMAKELRLVQDDIVRKLTLGSFAISVLQLGITLTIEQPAPPPPLLLLQCEVKAKRRRRRRVIAGLWHWAASQLFQPLATLNSVTLLQGNSVDPEHSVHGSRLCRAIRRFIFGRVPSTSAVPGGLIHFNMSELEVATHNFSEENLIASGAFAKVFKGVLSNGLAVALKNFNMFYGYDYGLRNEIKIGGMLEHRNVVKTLGYCIHDKVVSVCHNGREIEATEPRRILVTEYLPNKSLRNITKEAQRVFWPFCFRIIQGISQGLHYVHEQNVVHLDLKPDNIVFDSDMNPVIIDFGVSVVVDNKVGVVTTGQLVGTMGYMAPEYIDKGVVSNKCDVFAFGVVLLRTIFQACAKLEFQDYYYRLHADSSKKWEDMHKIKELFDPRLVGESEVTDVARCLKVGLQCIEFDAANRPTLVEVVDMLNGGRGRVASLKQQIFALSALYFPYTIHICIILFILWNTISLCFEIL